MSDNDIEFAKGLLVKAPHPKAPDFVKAQISIKVEELGMWLREKHKAGEEWVNLDVKESKGGRWYAAVSNFKPQEKTPKPEADRGKSGFDDLSDLPF